jgi:hypothetical protein
MKTFLTGTFIKWLARRGLELGGLLGALAAVDPTVLQTLLSTIAALLTGDFDNVSLGALIGLASTVGGLIWNARSTFSSHVTVDAQQTPTGKLRGPAKTLVEEVARNERARSPSLLDKLFGH